MIVNLKNPSRNTGEASSDTFNSIENITGSAFADTLTGDDLTADGASPFRNHLSGGNGNDTLTGLKGVDTLDGGSGIDTAVFQGKFADYEIDLEPSLAAGTIIRIIDQQADRDANDLLIDIEALQFADLTFRFENHAPTALTLSTSQIVEDMPVTAIEATLSASDADAGDTIIYELVSTDGPFRIDGNNLVLTGPLDFETKPQHSYQAA